MKKITAFALLSIAIISCNKETKTVTKVDPKTGKTITVEVPAEKSEETATVANPAIKDSLGVYYSTFKLEKGKTYPFTTYQRDTQTMSDGSKSMTGTNESTDEMNFTVNGIDEKGNYDITMNLVGKRMSASAQGKTQTIDTKGTVDTVGAVNNLFFGKNTVMAVRNMFSGTGMNPLMLALMLGDNKGFDAKTFALMSMMGNTTGDSNQMLMMALLLGNK